MKCSTAIPAGGSPVPAESLWRNPLSWRRFSKDAGRLEIPTALDTTGHASRSALEQVLAYTDLFLFDLKCMDSADSLASVGQSNELMLENAEHVMQSGVPIIIRVPLIPGITEKTEIFRNRRVRQAGESGNAHQRAALSSSWRKQVPP